LPQTAERSSDHDSYRFGFGGGSKLSLRISDGKGYSPDGFFRFREAFWKSGQPSVDAFLEWRPDFIAIGKLAIAYCLLPFEDESKLFTPPGNRGGDWYEYLSVKLNRITRTTLLFSVVV
jgi:hypothetical protein